MFTGIIEATGRLESISPQRLVIAPNKRMGSDPIKIGESIAVNGCCLTVVPGSTDQQLLFDLSPETWQKTAFEDSSVGDEVNLERAMRADGRFGGHIVQGHVDGTARIRDRREQDHAVIFTIDLPPNLARYVIDKGSITLNGVSLTVVNLNGCQFDVWLIPQTLAETTLGSLRAGDRVNIEVDLLAKYLERLSTVG